ncbi:uncharacterized protein B0T15DRAFT_547546 [Chaetomium strumarium]|uniref:DUF7728 domain-containing protein n=1 Tax=Chaetomium strumarium TaxID=1170767 RepID=A0AAJ0H3C9_9PEZI|nr:hypothetical protein B0T15DRAFT_547546 [Chaetomium strumarium]
MLLKPLTVAAGLLAVPAAHAFLIPPEVSDADVQVANTIENIASQVAENQVVNVECPRCPILVNGRRGRPVQLKIHRPSHLELTFSVDRQPDHDRLLVNGFELYPSSDPLGEALVAPQVIDGKRRETRRHREHDQHDGKPRAHRKRPHRLEPQPQRLGYGLRVGPAKKDADGQFELIEVDLQILEVGVTFIDGIPGIRVKLIQDGEGRLLMSQIEKSEPKNLLESPKGGPEECTTAMCKWLAIAREKLKNLKPFKHCHGPHVKGGMGHDDSDGVPHPYPHHQHGPHAGHWAAPYHEHRWGKLFKHIASHILLPVLVGIFAGVSISLIGMAVGTVIVSLWRIFFRRKTQHGHRRRHSRRHSQLKAASKEAAFDEENASLMEHRDPPPSYQEEEAAKTAQA